MPESVDFIETGRIDRESQSRSTNTPTGIKEGSHKCQT